MSRVSRGGASLLFTSLYVGESYMGRGASRSGAILTVRVQVIPPTHRTRLYFSLTSDYSSLSLIVGGGSLLLVFLFLLHMSHNR